MRSLASLEMTISVINPIHIPSSPCHAVALRRRVAFVYANEFTILQLQIPFGAHPGFFVPPISGKKIWTPLIADFSRNFRTANMREGVFIQQDRCRCGRPKSAQRWFLL